MNPIILEIVAPLGVAGVALYVFYLVMTKAFKFKLSQIGQTWSALIAVLFIVAVAFVTHAAITKNNISNDARKDTLSAADIGAIYVRVDSPETGKRDAQGRKLYAVTLTIHVDRNKTEEEETQVLSHIVNVDYGLDHPTIPKPVDQPPAGLINNFKYVVQMWGAIKVKAAIRITNPDTVIIREGQMVLGGTAELRAVSG